MFSSSDATQLSSSDLEVIILQCTKSLDSVDQVTRHAHAQLVGHLLASTQIERVVLPPETSHKGKKDQGAEQHVDNISSSMHAAAEITKPMVTPNDESSTFTLHCSLNLAHLSLNPTAPSSFFIWPKSHQTLAVEAAVTTSC